MIDFEKRMKLAEVPLTTEDAKIHMDRLYDIEEKFNERIFKPMS
jgi:hypothetical protein